jgi:UDP-glucose:(glucosyl)LPS alpha-1,2-glucosyltransferase
MKFKITGIEEDRENIAGSIDDNGNVVGAKGGTEMIKEELLSRLDDDLLDEFNIIHSRVRNLDPNKKNVLVLHDLWQDPEAQHLKDPESRKRFSKLVFVSNWQFQTYHMGLGIPYSDAVVLRNAIEPINDIKKEKDGPIRLIYHTTPHRGLELLLPIYEALYNKWGDKIVLDVYSSFSIYGWPQRDEQYQHIFDKCAEHPGINYHGAVPNEEVREALRKAHIFAYPSIWQETSCISAIEALSAKCAVVCPNLAALPETVANFGLTYQFDENGSTHANRHLRLLDAVIEDYWNEAHLRKLDFQKTYVDNFYSWDNRIGEWNNLLRNL